MHRDKRENWKMNEKNKGKKIEENERNVSVWKRPTMRDGVAKAGW